MELNEHDLFYIIFGLILTALSVILLVYEERKYRIEIKRKEVKIRRLISQINRSRKALLYNIEKILHEEKWN